MSSNNQGNSSSRGMRRANAVRARNRSSSQGDSLTHFDPVSASIAQGDYSTSASQSVSGVSASLRGPSDFATASEAVSYPQYNYSQSGDPAGSVGTPAPPYVTNASSSSQSATDGTSTSTGVDAPPNPTLKTKSITTRDGVQAVRMNSQFVPVVPRDRIRGQPYSIPST
ncbi:hypothetical protein CI109_102268 [Kwoniella shandongensis]|uniref:Uncharacterized protein n=1 Tax=Kwoniella shandongensis TaxID=1734106 RepID=A0AAJ8MUC2_9TREE